jgi:hypothetical protein
MTLPLPPKIDQDEPGAWSKVVFHVRRLGYQFWFLLILGTLSLLLLAYRIEVNSAAIEQGFYDACVGRQERTQAANDKREVLIQAAVTAPGTDPAKHDEMLQKLRDALLLPIEECNAP